MTFASKIKCENRDFFWVLWVRTYVFYRPVGFNHTSFVFAQEANMHENKYNSYKVPSGLLILFLEKALTLVHMETHLDDVSSQNSWGKTSIISPFWPILPINWPWFSFLERGVENLQSAIFAYWAPQLRCFCRIDGNPTNRPGDRADTQLGDWSPE